MFCTNCGTEVQDNVMFCPGCGANLGGGAQPQQYAEQPAQMQQQQYAQQPYAQQPYAQQPYGQPQQFGQQGQRPGFQMPSFGGTSLQGLSFAGFTQETILYFGAAALHLLLLIMWFVPALTLKISFLGMTEKASISMHALIESFFIRLIAVLLILAAIALNALGGLGKRMILATIIGIVSVVWYFGWMMLGFLINLSDVEDVGGTLKFNFGGVLIILLSLLLIALYVVRAVVLRKKKA